MQQQIPRLRRDLGLIETPADAQIVLPFAPAEPEIVSGDPPVAAPGTSPLQALHRLLEEKLRLPPDVVPGKAEPVGAEDAETEKPAAADKAAARIPIRLVKVALGLAIVALFGWMPVRTLLQSSSVEAIVNSRIVTVRAPIEGDVVANPAGLSGDGILARNQPLLRIENVRADRSRLDDLKDQLGRTEIERATLDAKIAVMQRSYDALVGEVARFTGGRVKQLEARTAEFSAEIDIAKARRELARSNARRAVALSKSSTISAAELERVAQEQTIAEQTAIGAERKLEAANIELAAARSGSFLGDSYNDMPSSAQRRDDLRQRLDELAADRDAAVAQIARLRAEGAAESARYQAFADVAVSLPVSGRIWEVMTSPGEHVQIGQELLKILDCSGAVVTANVTEAVYNRLRVGAPARFRPTDGGGDLAGVVTNLTGLAEVPANLAIIPSALSREAYHVTVRVPQLASEQSCAIGQTGRVIFDKAPADAR